ncbi:glycosyltransferase [Lacinutrix sp. MEBiC02595]
MKGISVIVCCYNSVKLLPETLAYLAKQQVDNALAWEVILVNNNSTDATKKVADALWQSYGVSTVFRIIDEPQPGLSHAREAGMRAATYDTFLWCDDDNWLCETYVQTAYTIMEAHPNIGALGGWCEAAFESEKPIWFDQQARYFAVSRQGKKSGDITTKKGCVYGAGMVLRKVHWLQLQELGFTHLLSDRVGNTLSSGGDTEYCYALRLLGYKMWFDERLYFKHYMTDGRMDLGYVKRIRKAMAHSNFVLWPYLDVLQDQQQTAKTFRKKAFKGFPILPIKKVGALVFGTLEQKAVASRYFTHFKYRLFQYRVYKKNHETLFSWYNKIASKPLTKV